jgi:hypothetical protein
MSPKRLLTSEKKSEEEKESSNDVVLPLVLPKPSPKFRSPLTYTELRDVGLGVPSFGVCEKMR